MTIKNSNLLWQKIPLTLICRYDEAKILQIEAQKSKEISALEEANQVILEVNNRLNFLDLQSLKLAFLDKNRHLTSTQSNAIFRA